VTAVNGGTGVPSGWPRIRAVLLLGVGVAAGAAAITLLSQIMRSVTSIGGSCADGGPYVSAQPCPQGTGTALLLIFPLALTSIVGTLWGAGTLKAPLPLWLAWPAIFLTLGWNFLEDGFFPPPEAGGIVVGYVVCGVLFVLMGAGPLLLALSVVRDRRRTRRAEEGLARVPGPRTASSLRPTVTTPKPPPARRTPGPRQGDDPAAAAMSVAGRLERLAALHGSGELTDEEYAQAKAATLREAR
jgi:hypothetical protein